MLKTQNPQLDVFTSEVYRHLVPSNHLLVQIAAAINFDFVIERLEDKYSNMGRGSYDPRLLFKLLLLSYLYQLSDIAVIERSKTDIVFRWFLGLSIYDQLPDDTTLSYFRIKRLDTKTIEELFNDIVDVCIKKNIVKSKRIIIDSTDVAANTNYPSRRTLINQSFYKAMKQLARLNQEQSEAFTVAYDQQLDSLYQSSENVDRKMHAHVAKEVLSKVYLQTHELMVDGSKYKDAFELCYQIIQQVLDSKTSDCVVSTVDPDARVAHKSPRNVKRGYKDHIGVDEDSEIILATTVTPFNVGDEKKLTDLVEKVQERVSTQGKTIEQVSADSVYSTHANREFLYDKDITSYIPFYKEHHKDDARYGARDFTVHEDMSKVTCPMGEVSKSRTKEKSNGTNEFNYCYRFDKTLCAICPMRKKCVVIRPDGKIKQGRVVKVPTTYKIIQADRERSKTEAAKEASQKRFKVERRFAALVHNHMLRRSRFVRLKGATIHVFLSHMACNINRLVRILASPDLCEKLNVKMA